MPRGRKGQSSGSRGRKSTGKAGGNKRSGQNDLVFHEIGRNSRGQGRMNEEGY